MKTFKNIIEKIECFIPLFQTETKIESYFTLFSSFED